MARDRGPALVAALALALSAVPAARAEPGGEAMTDAKIAALPIASTSLDKHIRRKLAAQLVEGLRRGPFEVMPPAEVYAAYPDSIEVCETLACFAEVERITGSNYSVRTEVDVERKDYHFKIRAYDVANERFVATVEDTCEVCGGADAGQLIADLAAALVRDLEQSLQPAVLQLDSTPSGATVFLDDVEVGSTPLELSVDAGPHDLRVVKRGFASQSRTIDVVGGVRETQSVTLQKLVEDQRAIPAWPGWALVGTGAGTVVAGITLIAIDEQPIRSRCTGENVDEAGNCRFRQNTLPLGLALTLGGVVLAAAGTTLLLVRQRRGRPVSAARLRPTTDGVVIRF